MRGIDVSENNGTVDWQAVAADGNKFAIIRCTYGKSGEDEKFLENVNGAHAAGLQCGAYHYSYALDECSAKTEAEHCLEVINRAGVTLELPVFFDMEDADQYKANHDFDFSMENVTAICRSFLSNMPLNKGVYASEDWFNNRIDWKSLGVSVWNAAWPGWDINPEEHLGYDGIGGYMWQYTDAHEIEGNTFDADWIYE